MSKNGPPTGKPWVWLTKEMMKSDAWRSAGINCHRFIEFLLVEYMEHGGANNGRIKAPYDALEQIGISSRLITAAVAEAEALGLVDCCRGGLRAATIYTLTWLPANGDPPSDRWRLYRNPRLKPWPCRKPAKD